MKRIVRYFLQGLLYITPFAVTIYVFVFIFTWIDGLLRGLALFEEGAFADYSFPGIGILIILGGVTLVGFIGQRLLSAPLISFGRSLLERAPLVKLIYSSVKDLLSAFVGQDRKFEKPVLVKLDKTNVIERLGFVTTTDMSALGVPDKIAVYLPSSYGMLGELVVVPKDHVTPLDVNSAEVMKFIVSGGITKISDDKHA